MLQSFDTGLKWSAGALITITAVTYNVFEAQICVQNSYSQLPKLDYFEFAICTFLGLAFLVVGATMAVTVRKYSPQFY